MVICWFYPRKSPQITYQTAVLYREGEQSFTHHCSCTIMKQALKAERTGVPRKAARPAEPRLEVMRSYHGSQQRTQIEFI